jgi:hypothetical protein
MTNLTRPRWLGPVAAFVILFGAMTIQEGGSVLFIEGQSRAAAGHYVPWVVWFNFLAGFAYIATGIGLWRRALWAPRLAAVLAAGTLLVFAALGVHIATGHAFEVKTLAAMTVRSGLWVTVTVLLRRSRPSLRTA